MSDTSGDLPRVGFVGLGRMGVPMCRRLLGAGFPLVVHNRTPGKAGPLLALGAVTAPTVGAVAEASEIVLTCLDSEAASEQVFLGPEGLLASARSGSVLVEHGTIGPATARALGAAAARGGLDFLDAPVSGGPEGAERGTLTIMVGGTPTAFERVRPVFSACGRTVVRMGGVGAGSLTKLVNQLLTFVHGVAAAEALALAERTGLDLRTLGDVLGASFGQSRMLERSLARVLAQDFEAGAPLRLYAKDLRLLEMLGQDKGASLPLERAAGAILDRALQAGLGERDVAGLLLLYRHPAAVEAPEAPSAST